MKRLCLFALLLAVAGAALYAQPYANTLFFSEYLEGSSNNKALEIFNGTGAPVDLSQYTVKLGSNGGTWGNTLTLSGTLANNDVYVIANAQANAAILAVSDVTSTVTYFNGDDALGLFQGETLIDVIGQYLTDPGTAWDVAGTVGAMLNHTLIRKSTIVQGNTDWAVSAGTNADNSEWIVEAQDYATNLGAHLFEPGGSNTVATPVIAPGGGIYTAPVSVTITCSTPSSSIFYTLDGSTPSPSSTPYTAPVTIGGTTTLKAIATAAGMTNSSVATAAYTFPIALANLTALRAATADGTTVYHVSGEVMLSFQQTFRNQKYLQDSTAGILVDDQAGTVTTTYSVGDGITGITGRISEYGGMLQFVPVANFASASSTGNAITPVVATYAQLTSAFDTYESRLVKVLGVTFTEPTGVFANGVLYPTTDPTGSFNIRTTFYDVDYISANVPTTTKDITGIPNSRVTEGNLFTPRSAADFADPAGTIAAPAFSHPSGNYFAPFALAITCVTPGVDIFYTLDGSVPTMDSEVYSDPITISATTTVKAKAFLGPPQFSEVSTAVYSFPLNVNNLADLRESTPGGLYRLTAPVVVSFAQSFRHQKFVQDAGAGILIDDLNGVITQTYQPGDAIANLTGTLAEFGGMLQLVPVADPGPPASTGNQLTPIPLTLAQFNAGFEDYESRLVTVNDMIFFNPTGSFANGASYPIEDESGDNTANFRATFYDVDYIGLPVYAYQLNVTGIPNSRTDGNYFTARKVDDFQLSEVIAPGFAGAYIDEYPDVVTLYASYVPYHFYVIPAGLTGYRLYRDNAVIQEHGPAVDASWTDTPDPGSHTYYATAMFGTTESAASETFVFNVTANPEEAPEALSTALLGNFPNPFHPHTRISYSLKDAAPVRIAIYNQKGQLVRVLCDAAQGVGNHQIAWDGTDNAGSRVGNGIYFYRLTSGDYTQTKKMLMLK